MVVAGKQAEPFTRQWAGWWAEALCSPGYGIFPGLVPSRLTGSLRALLDSLTDDLAAARTGRGEGLGHRPGIRTDEIFWLDESALEDAGGEWLGQMEAVRLDLRETLRMHLSHYEGHLARYRPGGFYRPHLDQHLGTSARQVTVILYLNADWESGDGGQLRLFTSPELGIRGPSELVEPRAGTVVVFRSAGFWHEVLPARRERLSLTGWFRLPAEPK